MKAREASEIGSEERLLTLQQKVERGIITAAEHESLLAQEQRLAELNDEVEDFDAGVMQSSPNYPPVAESTGAGAGHAPNALPGRTANEEVARGRVRGQAGGGAEDRNHGHEHEQEEGQLAAEQEGRGGVGHNEQTEQLRGQEGRALVATTAAVAAAAIWDDGYDAMQSPLTAAVARHLAQDEAAAASARAAAKELEHAHAAHAVARAAEEERGTTTLPRQEVQVGAQHQGEVGELKRSAAAATESDAATVMAESDAQEERVVEAGSAVVAEAATAEVVEEHPTDAQAEALLERMAEQTQEIPAQVRVLTCLSEAWAGACLAIALPLICRCLAVYAASAALPALTVPPCWSLFCSPDSEQSQGALEDGVGPFEDGL